jgi:23S rRNA pseudouridine2605 synthase
MSKHQDSKGKGKPSGRGNAKSKTKSFSRGDAPVKKKTVTKTVSNPDEMRLNKYVSNSGTCSRREADENIAIGLVSVNGKVITEMGYKVKRTDEVRFDGRRINPEPNVYVLLNKPKGFGDAFFE